MAELYLCSSRGPGGFEKDVVIKRIRPFLSSDPEFVRMFIAEARLASRLNHANLVQIFDFDKHEDTYYLAMEYVRGRSLADVRKRSKELMIAMHPTLVAHIGAEVARGLHCAHQLAENGKPLGLVHRDVTPHNVLLSFDGAVKLTDFGIAKADNTDTSPGRLKGKFGYMSPEQSRGEWVDARTDVFALGIVLWEMLAGGRLFEADSDAAMIRAVQESSIASPARLNSTVPPDLDAAVMRALQRDRQRRYQSAQELERALAQCVLHHAKALEDTDLAGFLRALYPAPAAVDNGIGLAARRSFNTVVARASRCPAEPIAVQAEDSRAPTRLLQSAPRRLPPWALNIPSAIWVGLSTFLLVGTAVALVGARSARGSREINGAAQTVEPFTRSPPWPEAPDNPVEGKNLLQAPPQNSEATAEAPPPRPIRQPMGTLALMVTPWAHVEIDGRDRGEVSGMRRYELAAGKHRLRLSHPRGTRELSVTVSAGRKVTEEHRMLPR